MDPLNAYVCHALAALELRLRNFDSAKIVLEKVVWQRPTAAICVALADLERQLGNVDRAKQVLLHGLKRCNRERSQLYLSLAWVEEDAFRNLPEAFELIAQALEEDPKNVKIYIAKASMELRLNRVDEAKNTLKQCLPIEAQDGAHYTMLGNVPLYFIRQKVMDASLLFFFARNH